MKSNLILRNTANQKLRNIARDATDSEYRVGNLKNLFELK